MLPTAILDRFVERCPAVVMVRATLEKLLRPNRLDPIFADAKQRQYTKRLLFSQVVAVMASVVTRTHSSVHSAYLAMKDRLGVSPAALYEKLNHTEPEVASVMIRQTAGDAAKVIDSMPSAKTVIVPGLEVFDLDGNHLAATEHRLAELRATREGPLPGQSLALLDAQRELIVDLVPCEDGHAQERALLPELLQRLRERIVIVADRNFCTTKFLFGLARRPADFVIRQHGSTLTWKLRGQRRRVGRIAPGVVHEQGVELHWGDATLSIRRVTLGLDQPTEGGDTEIHILTNLSADQATGSQVAQAYGTRWTVEGAFQTLTDVLGCEVETLVLHADETGWRVDGATFWLWCFASKDVTYYMIDRRRGSPALKRFFKTEFAGVLVTDFWGASNAVVCARKQKCLPHLLRDLKRTQHYHKPGGDWPAFSKQLKRLIRDSIRLSKRRSELSAKAFASRRRRLDLRLHELLAQPWEQRHARRLVKRLRRHSTELFTFLDHAEVPFDNNHGERQIRPAVIARTNSYANGSADGAETQAILMSVFRTLKQRGHNPVSAVTEAIRAHLRTGQLPLLPAPFAEVG